MPQGKGTYGTKRGRPPKKRYKEGGWTWKKLKANADKLYARAKEIASERTKSGSPVLVGNKDMVEARKSFETKPKTETKTKPKTETKTKPKTETKSKPKKKFDYRNKMGTQMTYKKALKNARGRTASEIANDPAFFSNTSEGKYLRGIHKGLSKKGMMGGGMVKYSGGGSVKRKPSTKVSAGNKWN